MICWCFDTGCASDTLRTAGKSAGGQRSTRVFSDKLRPLARRLHSPLVECRRQFRVAVLAGLIGFVYNITADTTT